MNLSSAVEIESKYAVGDDVVLPPLDGVPGVVSADAQPVAQLDAVYLDTADGTLTAARIALRRRTGGHDAGWHVKLRAAEGRTELHAPIDPAHPDALPPALETALRSRLRGRAVQPIALIRTERHAVVVRDVDGGEVEVVDDHVRATDVAAGVLRIWREWEAEQTGPKEPSAALLARVDRALLAAGATVSASPAKLAQALGQDGPAAPPKRPKHAGGLLTAAVAEHAETLHGLLTTLSVTGDPDGEVVHELRKTVRRITSLTALTPVAGPSGARLRERLRRLGTDLGAARDPLVAAGIAEALLADLPAGTPGRDAAAAALVTAPRRLAGTRTEEAAGALGAPAALETWAALDAFVADGPDARRSPRVLKALAARTVRRAARRGRRAGRDVEALHAARRAAKRARMVVEACIELGVVAPGSALAAQGGTARGVQDVLGDHRDVVLLLESLPDAAARVPAGAYAIGYVARLAEERAAMLLSGSRKAIRRLS